MMSLFFRLYCSMIGHVVPAQLNDVPNAHQLNHNADQNAQNKPRTENCPRKIALEAVQQFHQITTCPVTASMK